MGGDSREKGHTLSGVLYEGLTMEDVERPIDVFTVGHGYTVNGVTFRNIKSMGRSGGGFQCSSESPCKNIVLDNVQLGGKSWKCSHVIGTASGTTPDASKCFSSALNGTNVRNQSF